MDSHLKCFDLLNAKEVVPVVEILPYKTKCKGD